MWRLLLASACCGLFSVAAASAQNLIMNGGFERPPLPAGDPLRIEHGGRTFHGWTVVGPRSLGVSLVNVNYTENFSGNILHFTPAEGAQSVDLSGPSNEGPVGVQQAVPTTAGDAYVLSFSLANQDDSYSLYSRPSALEVYIDGVSVYTFHDSSINIDLILAVGTHKMTVKAWDTTGSTISSSITVTATDNPPPPPPPGCTAGALNTVNICAPLSGATVSSPVDVEAFVNASTSVTATAIYIDGVLKWSGPANPQVSASLATAAGTHKITVKGWTTIMILVGLGSSAQLLMTGILGENVGRIYEEVKRRPLYVLEGAINLPPADPAAKAGPPSTPFA